LLAAEAVILTEMDAISKLEEQIAKCATDTQKKTLNGIIRRRNLNYNANFQKKLQSQKEIRQLEVFLKPQVWVETINQKKGKGIQYTNRFTSEGESSNENEMPPYKLGKN